MIDALILQQTMVRMVIEATYRALEEGKMRLYVEPRMGVHKLTFCFGFKIFNHFIENSYYYSFIAK